MTLSKELAKEKYKTDSEYRAKKIAAALKYYHKNRDKCRVVKRKHQLKARYGLTPRQLDAMEWAQKGHCGLCGEQRVLIIDHNHITKKVRRLICVPCNILLGVAGDSEFILQLAINYLQENK